MAHAELERTVRVRARHHYRRLDWSDARNREVFGAVTDPHEHDYAITVTVRGDVDRYGFVVDLSALDDAIGFVVAPLDGHDLNQLDFGEGVVQPTTEALARWLWDRLVGRIPGPAKLIRVRVAENSALAAVWEG